MFGKFYKVMFSDNADDPKLIQHDLQALCDRFWTNQQNSKTNSNDLMASFTLLCFAFCQCEMKVGWTGPARVEELALINPRTP